MKTFLVLIAIVGTVVAKLDLYPGTYDDLQTDAVLTDPKTLLPFLLCINDQGPCNEAGDFYRKKTGEAVATDCLRCTPKQRHIMRTFLEQSLAQYPEQFDDFLKIYDPEGIYYEKLKQAVHNA